ncbi:cytochrome c oxidase subunit 3 [Flavobacterium rhizosphaerae]|uniref:Cytochrome c oxidase subunit 3 n=1 Tax=Flavobacterium rhizosphaerae TaxID=3163298 RepID=A0ABW8YV93_9FLAO
MMGTPVIKMTLEEHNAANVRSKKMLLWFAMVSMFMMFAGLTSAYVVSSKRPDWLGSFELPMAFTISTVLIVISSLTFFLAKQAIKKDDRNATTLWLLATLALGIGFIFSQFAGFSSVIAQNYYFTGPYSNVTTSFLYIVTVTHLAHLFAGIIVLLVVIYNHFKHKYNSSQTLGLELGAMFWHFLDVLWVYLFLFFCFYK